MKGFTRALRGELYLWISKRSVRWAHLAVIALAAGAVLWGRVLLGLRQGLGGGGAGEAANWNFWPQFTDAARVGFFLVEVLTLILIAGSLPREIGLGAARDPLVRGIARSAFVAARACIAVLLPLTLAACAIAAAAGTAALLFDAGDIVEGGDVLLEAEELAPHVFRSLRDGLPPLLALGAVSLWLSVVSRHAVIGVGAGLLLVLAPRFLHDALGSAAPWIFPNALAGLGTDSYLAEIAKWAQGYSDAFPQTFDAVIAAGRIAPWPVLALAWIGAVLGFRRRPV